MYIVYFFSPKGQFTEDGSFIGQYVPGKLQPPVSPQPVNNTPASHTATAPSAPAQQNTAVNTANTTAAVATYV